MSENKKPRADAKLKTLPEDRQLAIIQRLKTPKETYTTVRAWLQDDGVETSESGLHYFWDWWHLRQRLQRNESTVQDLLNDMKQENPSMTNAQLDQAGQRFFTALAISEEDSLAWKRVQDARAKLGLLQLTKDRLALLTCELFLKWFADQKAREIAESSMPNSEKIAALRQTYFKEIDELEKSGEVQLPQ